MTNIAHLTPSQSGIVWITWSQFRGRHGMTTEGLQTTSSVTELAVRKVLYGGRTGERGCGLLWVGGASLELGIDLFEVPTERLAL